MKVHINAGGREVEIECSDTNLNPKDVADKALEVWHATEGAKTTESAYGFTQERKAWQTSPMNMGGGIGYVHEPKAETP